MAGLPSAIHDAPFHRSSLPLAVTTEADREELISCLVVHSCYKLQPPPRAMYADTTP